MKTLTHLLRIIFVIILLGFYGKAINSFSGGQTLFVFGIMLYLLFGIIYIVMAMIQKKHRREAAMIAFAHPLIAGILFSIMYWVGGGILIIVGSSILTIGSIIIFVRSKQKKAPVDLPMLYLAIGLGSTFFCFKFMNWPTDSFLFIPIPILSFTALYYLIKNKYRFNLTKLTLLLIISLFMFLKAGSRSEIFQFKHLIVGRPESNHPEVYHDYAWYLYSEGKTEQAKTNLQSAIRELANPENIYYSAVKDNSDYLEKYEKAMMQLMEDRWIKAERQKK